MNSFWSSDTYKIVQAMKASGNRMGLIAEWKAAVEQWALGAVNIPGAIAVRVWLPLWQVRPFYTATELAPMWPALACAIGCRNYLAPQKSPSLLARELDFAGLPSREIAGKKYYLVEQIHVWRDAPDAAFLERINA